MKSAKLVVPEVFIAALIVVAVFALINPFGMLMGPAIEMGLVAVLAVSAILFAIFIWREQPADEREAYNGQRTARLGYFVGGAVLLAGTFIQALAMKVDPWLPATLGCMVVAKLIMTIALREK